MITSQQALQKIIDHQELEYDEMVSLMHQIMQGEISPIICAAILTGLKVKKESINEITAAAQVMRKLSEKVEVANPDNLLDIVGTGGDGAHTFNISTASMIVASAAGIRVAKHGNRAASSKSGSADVLEKLGVNINLNAKQVSKCIDEVGIGFMFAPKHHQAMKNVIGVRKEIGIKTIFNILGPLTNPANASHTLMGVFNPELVGIQARVMKNLGAKRAMIVHGLDGIDEITLGASTMIAELKDEEIIEYEIHPEEFGVEMCQTRNLQVDDANQSKAKILSVLANDSSPQLDIVVLNAGAAIYCAEKTKNINDGISLAKEVIANGKAKQKLEQLISFSNSI